LNGKKFAWQGVALLPFVDEKRLKKAVKSLFDELTEDESKSVIFINFLSRFSDLIMFFVFLICRT